MTSDVREDCRSAAHAMLWRVWGRLRALPESERLAYADACVRHVAARVLQDEQRQRAALGRDVFPLDEEFLHALDQIGEAGGVALGVDRLLMLLTGAQSIAEVLLFPAADEYPRARS